MAISISLLSGGRHRVLNVLHYILSYQIEIPTDAGLQPVIRALRLFFKLPLLRRLIVVFAVGLLKRVAIGKVYVVAFAW